MTNTQYSAGGRQTQASQPLVDSRYPAEQRQDFVRDLGNAICANPVATALIGMGALWLFLGGSKGFGAGSTQQFGPTVASTLSAIGAGVGKSATAAGSKVGEAVSSAASQVSGAISSTYERVGSATDTAADVVSRTGTSLHETTRAAQDAGSGAARTVQRELSALFERQPLVLGAVGLAIGAGIAAAFPTTEMESRAVGEFSDELKARTREQVSDQLENATTVAGHALKEVKREADALM
jgi:hypothetical protein